MKKRFFSLSLAFLLISLVLTLSVSATESETVWSGSFEPINSTAGATLEVSGPSSVYLGDSFDVTFAWKNINFDQYRAGSIDIYFYFDARYVAIPANAVALVELGGNAWENYSTASVAASSDTASADMKLMKVAIVIPEDYSVTENTLTVTVKFDAVSVGTSEFDWLYAAIAAYGDSSFEHYAEVANALENTNVDLEYSVTVMVRKGEAFLYTDKDTYAHDDPIMIKTEGDIDGRYVGIADEKGNLLGVIPASKDDISMDDPAWSWKNGFGPKDIKGGQFTIGWVDADGNWVPEELDSRITITVGSIPDTGDAAEAMLLICVAISALTVLALTVIDSKRRYNN